MPQPLANALPDLALEAVEVQRQLDQAWQLERNQLHTDFASSGLAHFDLGKALEHRLRPPRPWVSRFHVVLQSDVTRDATREGGLEIRPLNAGYRALFGITRQAHCRIELEIRQSPVTPSPPLTQPPPVH
jgi:hypothetical protein